MRNKEEKKNNAHVTFFISTYKNDVTDFKNSNHLILDNLNILKYYLKLYLDYKLYNNTTHIRVIAPKLEIKSSDFIISLLDIFNSFNDKIIYKNRSNIKFSFYGEDIFNKVDIYKLLLYNYQFFIEISDIDKLISNNYINLLNNYYKITKYYNKFPIIYHILVNKSNEDRIYDLWKNNFFKNKKFITLNFIHPCNFKNSPLNIDIYNGGIIKRIGYNTDICNIYSDKIAIDFINKKIGKCFKLWEYSPKIELNKLNFLNCLSFEHTHIFKKFNEPICKICECYGTNKEKIFYE